MIMDFSSVLAQDFEDSEAVTSYVSRQLKPDEIKYAPLQKEALAIVWSLRYFHHYIHVRHFTVVTDHRPSKWLQTMKTPSNLMAR